MLVAAPGASSPEVVEFMGEESFAGFVNGAGGEAQARAAGPLGREGRERFSGEGGGFERGDCGLGEGQF